MIVDVSSIVIKERGSLRILFINQTEVGYLMRNAQEQAIGIQKLIEELKMPVKVNVELSPTSRLTICSLELA